VLAAIPSFSACSPDSLPDPFVSVVQGEYAVRYLLFLKYLLEKDAADYSGLENDVMFSVSEGQADFLPSTFFASRLRELEKSSAASATHQRTTNTQLLRRTDDESAFPPSELQRQLSDLKQQHSATQETLKSTQETLNSLVQLLRLRSRQAGVEREELLEIDVRTEQQ